MNSEFPAAVHLLVYLAHLPGRTANSEELALSLHINPARVRKTMRCLREQGWVSTREGLGGGYSLDADPAALRLSDVYRATDCGGLRPKKGTGRADSDCPVGSGIAGAMDGYFAEAERRYLEAFDGVTIRDVLEKTTRSDSSAGEAAPG
ncbi:Rrf2 family transcriptional regulator [Saccharibacillus sp. CPCC 101409]|uniref:RrF2 family transcriptional regulator n=1 Tax=Saccharibacillus sp. CPCC 101409 TaxID=3058041 RepID=UPI002673F161|nr:Rrf2 family transcriptional regulator [Saccharibacillus sp. CPCC 101409]MDO3409977.1 Rrf2 family transcriptional regulator [Saccharibacillus sp. CPCC 101409]